MRRFIPWVVVPPLVLSLWCAVVVGAGRGDDAPELGRREAGGLHEERGERHEDEEADVEKRHAERGPEPGKDAVTPGFLHRPGW